MLHAPSRPRLRAGTRSSRLARSQSARVGRELARLAGVSLPDEVVITTHGDRDQGTPLPEFDGRGVFTEALEARLLAGDIDFAVHSLKDVPVDLTPGLVLGAICFREDPRDMLVLARDVGGLDDLPSGARVGTCSVRRSAQLLNRRPDLAMQPLRGNVDTRLAKIANGEHDAIVLAAAGLHRLDLVPERAVPLPLELMLPAPGQGALAVQCRADDTNTRRLLSVIDDAAVREATNAERCFLEGLGGGCLAPIAAHAMVDHGVLKCTGLVASVDGAVILRVSETGPIRQGRELGLRLAEQAVGRGALDLLS